MSRLFVDLSIGDELTIGDTRIRLEKKSGQRARLVIITESKETPVNHSRRKAAEQPRMSAAPHQKEQSTHGKHPL